VAPTSHLVVLLILSCPMLGGVRQSNQQVRRWPPSASQYSPVSHRFKSHQIPSSSNHFTFGHFAPAALRLHRAAFVPLHQILRPLYRGSKSLPTKRTKEIPNGNHVCWTHSFYVPPSHTQAHEAVYHFSTNSVRHVVTGFSATEPQKARRRLPPTNASALLFAGRWRQQGSPNASFRATSQPQIHRRPTTPCRRLC